MPRSRFVPSNLVSLLASLLHILFSSFNQQQGVDRKLVRLSGRTRQPLSNMGYPILHPSGGGYIRNLVAYERQVHYLQHDTEQLSSGDPTAARMVLPMTIVSERVH